MVCRTLGFGGQKYPWGYIEKAEAIRLTKGITGVAYTDILNRGEVAQIIYNALFITTAAGDTLGARYFGENLGMMKIMIVATTRGTLLKEDAGLDKKVPGGTVCFKVIGEDGTLGDTPYFVDYKQLGIKSAHEAYDALGRAYSALFTVKGDNIVEIMGSKDDLVMTPAENTGLTSKDADGKYPIEKALAGLSLKSKYSKSNYIVKYGTTYDGEIIVRDKSGDKATVIGGEGKYAIDWNTGDILVKDPKGSVDVDGTKYAPKYFYNSLLGKYFEVKTKEVTGSTVSGEVKIVGITLIDDIFAALGNTKTDDTFKGGYTILDKLAGNSAYALLERYDINGDSKADWALYTEYRLGRFFEKDVKGTCPNGETDKAAYTITSLNGNAAKAWAIANDKSEAEYDNYPVVNGLVKEGACDHGQGYIDEKGLTPANGDYVLYAYNPSTKGIFVKAIIDSDKSDNTYVATGLLRAFDITGSKRSVTIGNDTLDFDYTNLAGNGMLLPENATPLARAIFSQYLNDKFMNFVKYVVVDGKLVWIEDALVTNGTKYIVVDSYAGVSADGYVVVNGYRSDALKYEQIRIGAYDQWLKGDIFNYFGIGYNFDELFQKQKVYKVTSYDAANDAYYVESNFEWNGTETTWEWKDGYRSNDKFKTESRAKAEDTFILILKEEVADDLGYAPVQVYTGKASNGSAFTGKKVADNIYYVEDLTSLKGTFALDNMSRYAVTYGLLISADYNSAKYVSASEATGKLLVGATYYDATVLDLYKGEFVDVKVLNKNLTKGLVYPVINGQIVARSGYNTDGFTSKQVEITGAAVTLLEDARPSWGYYDDTLTADQIFNKDGKLSQLLCNNHRDNFEKHLKVFNVTTDGDLIYATQIDKASKLPGGDGVENYKTFVIYGWKGAAEGDNSFAIVYVIGSGEAKTVGEGKDIDTTKIHQVVDGGYITGSVNAAVTTTTTLDKEGKATTSSSAAINSFSFWFIGAQSKVNHKEVADLDLYFGDAGLCTEESWQSSVTIDKKETKTFNGSINDAVYGEVKDYPAHGDDGDACNLVYKVTIDVSKLGITVDETTTKTFDVKFTGLKGEGTKNVYTANVTVTVKDGAVTYVINTIKNGEKTYDAIDLTVEAQAAKVIY
jgi:hypothetical protein